MSEEENDGYISMGEAISFVEALMARMKASLHSDFERAKKVLAEPRRMGDPEFAISLLHSSIDESGNKDAIPWLAYCYEHGYGVKRDKTVARCLYKLAEYEGSTEIDNLPKNIVVSTKERGPVCSECPAYERLSPEAFKPQTDDLYFDIETSGLDTEATITTICWFYHNEAKYWHYSGEEVRPDSFIADYNAAGRVVTYNGESFDIPRVCRKWGVSFPKVSVDLRRYVGSIPNLECHKMKYVSEQLGIPFHFDKDFSGYEAVCEWHKINSACRESGVWDDAYFTKLVKYCLHDVYLTRSLHYVLAKEPLPSDGILEAKMDSVLGYAFYEPTLPEGYAPLLKEIPPKYKERWPYVKEHPFTTLASSIVVITGEGRRITRTTAEELVVSLGAKLKPSKPTRDTDFCVVLGVDDPMAVTYASGKLERAKELVSQGSPIRVLNEDQFIELIEASMKEIGDPSMAVVKPEPPKCLDIEPTLRDEFEELWNSILADGVIEPCEVEMLRKWISVHDLTDGPFLDMLQLIDKVLEDGVVTYEEEMELYSAATECLKELEERKL